MMRSLQFGAREVCYELRKNSFSKCMRLHVFPSGRVLVTLPKYGSLRSAERFVKQKQKWITEKLTYYKIHATSTQLTDKKEYLKCKEKARDFLHRKIVEYNRQYGFSYARISVRNQKTRWGSCSAKGNLNFHYKILFLPEHLAQYLIVHELCHLKELNHSSKFWKLVSEAVPDYKAVRKALRGYSL